MPDIFVSADSKKTGKKPAKYSWEEEHPVMLHGEEILKGLQREKSKREMTKGSPVDVDILGKRTIITSPIGAFSSFKVKPKGVRFHEQDKDEQVLLLLRRHFATNIPWFLFGIILLLLPLLALYLFAFTNLVPKFTITAQMFIVLGFAYYLFVFCYLFVSYITWYYNTDLITNKKVIDIHFQDILYHHVSMTKLNLIEDVNYIQSGFFGSFFGYGDVFVETAGKSLTFEFMSVPNPERVVNLLESLIGGSADAE